MPRIALIAAALAATALPSLRPAEAADVPWTGTPTYLGGTSRYDAGEWIYTDFVFDDYGADTGAWGQPNVVSLASTTGDARYPAGDLFRGNAADIVEVRVRPSGDDLDVRVLLQTLVDSDVVALSVTGGGRNTVITNQNSAVDTDANTVSFTLVGAAAGHTVSLSIGAGLHDGNGGLRAGVPGTARTAPNEITTGGPTANRLFDLAFNTRQIEGRGGAWNEDAQARALAAGGAALEPFTQTIDVAKLRAGASTPAPSEPGYYVRLHKSAQPITEGMKASFPQYGGTWQPYALWIPAGFRSDAPNPLLLNMHSLSVHHNQYRGGSSPTYRTMYEQFGDGLDALVVTPLGRGPDGWYEDEALIDTLEVWADVAANYPVDRNRTMSTGYSMGGYGTYRLTTMLPDSFASAVSVVGPPGNGIWAHPLDPPGGKSSPDWTYPQLEATRHIPFWISHGMGDELVPWTGVKQQADRFGELGHEYRFALHPAADHFSFSAQDNWSREVAWLQAHMTRVVNPHEVVLRVRPASWATRRNATITAQALALADKLGAQFDGGYWVSDVVVRGNADADVTGVVELSSGGVARRRSGTTPITTVGVDGPSPHLLTGNDVAYGDAPTGDILRGRLAGVQRLTVDVGRAGLSDAPDVAITADGPVTITFVRAGAVVNTVTVG